MRGSLLHLEMELLRSHTVLQSMCGPSLTVGSAYRWGDVAHGGATVMLQSIRFSSY